MLKSIAKLNNEHGDYSLKPVLINGKVIERRVIRSEVPTAISVRNECC